MRVLAHILFVDGKCSKRHRLGDSQLGPGFAVVPPTKSSYRLKLTGT